VLPWSGEFSYGALVVLQAVADPYMVFGGWSGDLAADDNPLLLVMDRSWSLGVEFDSTEIFSDVDRDFWAANEIAACYYAGIVQGYGDGTYHPTEAVNRAQMAVYIARALAGGDAGVSASPTTVSFPDDVPADHWAYRYVEYAVGAGVVQGYDATHYQPDVILTRDQMAVFVARAKGWVSLAEVLNAAPELFADVPDGGVCGAGVRAGDVGEAASGRTLRGEVRGAHPAVQDGQRAGCHHGHRDLP
jgi:hypothetical protein